MHGLRPRPTIPAPPERPGPPAAVGARAGWARLAAWGARAAQALPVPSACAVCRSWPARPLCLACVARFAAPVQRCARCAIALPAGAGADACGACLREAPPLARCVAACAYGWPWTGLIARFKFGAEPGWAAPLAGLMRQAPGAAALLDGADLVLPVPLGPARLRERGFNQSFALARQLAPGRCDARLLLRTRDTPAQSGLPRAERLRNLRGVFAVEPLRAAALRGRRVLLVDDVMTSGATLASAARVLRDAGAASVDALVLARTG